MRISEIKALTDDRHIRLALSDFWEIPVVQEIMLSFPNNLTLDDIYNALREETIRLLESSDTPRTVRVKSRKAMKNLSGALFDDNHAWEVGTFIEIQRSNLQKKQELCQERYEKIEFIYERFGFNKQSKSRDIVWQLISSEVLFDAVVQKEKAGELQTIQDFYCCCERPAIELLQRSEIRYAEYWIMYALSKIVHQNPYYWLEINGYKQEDALKWQKGTDDTVFD